MLLVLAPSASFDACQHYQHFMSSSVSDASHQAVMGTNKLFQSLSFSIAPRSVSPSEVMTSFTLSVQHRLGLPLFLFPLNLACNALWGIRPPGILRICPNHQSLC